MYINHIENKKKIKQIEFQDLNICPLILYKISDTGGIAIVLN